MKLKSGALPIAGLHNYTKTLIFASPMPYFLIKSKNQKVQTIIIAPGNKIKEQFVFFT